MIYASIVRVRMCKEYVHPHQSSPSSSKPPRSAYHIGRVADESPVGVVVHGEQGRVHARRAAAARQHAHTSLSTRILTLPSPPADPSISMDIQAEP